MTRQINVRDFMESARLQPLHGLILAVCFLTAVVDGLDNLMIGFTAPAIASDLHIPLARFGMVFSAGLTGTLVGAVALGWLADKIGRRRALMLCTIVFGAFTIATPLAHTVTGLSALRFMGGLGLGGAMPGFLTLVSEYAPKSRKALATGLLWCGYPTGGVIGGLIGSQLLARGGWEVIFFIGGGLAFLVAALQWFFLPESLQFLARKGGRQDRIKRVAVKLSPESDLADAQFVADVAPGRRVGIREVFADGRGLPTVLLWIPLFMTFTLTTSIVLWMPGILRSAGMSIAHAAFLQALGNFGSLPSMAIAGYVLDRVDATRVLPFTYGAVALGFAIMSVGLKIEPVVAVAIVMIGFLGGPAIAGMLSLATSFYPSEVRSTGVGLAMGIGRSGQIAASLLIGWIISFGAGANWTVIAMGAPAVIAMICVIFLGMTLRARRKGASSASASAVLQSG